MTEFHLSEVSMEDFEELESINGSDDEESARNSTQRSNKRKGKTPHRYTDAEDIAILKEVLVEKVPRKGGVEKWKKIFDTVKIPVKDYKAIKTRFDVLFNCFTKDETIAFRGSGLEEDYDEKKRLMTDIVSQLEDWTEDSKTAKDKKRKDDSSAKAQAIRTASLATLRETSSVTDDDTTPKRKRLSHNSTDFVEILKQTEESERENKKAMIALESKRLEIMEKDFKLREENDTHRREMERRQMELEEKRITLEARRIEIDNIRLEKEKEERAMFLQLLQSKK